jgi:hypothetical protein
MDNSMRNIFSFYLCINGMLHATGYDSSTRSRKSQSGGGALSADGRQRVPVQSPQGCVQNANCQAVK